MQERQSSAPTPGTPGLHDAPPWSAGAKAARNPGIQVAFHADEEGIDMADDAASKNRTGIIRTMSRLIAVVVAVLALASAADAQSGVYEFVTAPFPAPPGYQP